MVTDEQKALKMVKNKGFQSFYMKMVNDILKKDVKRKKELI